MLNKDSFAAILLTLMYWIPSNIILYQSVSGNDYYEFPALLWVFFFPGWFLGFGFGYGGGNYWMILGQLISLVLIFLIVKKILKSYRRINENKN